jgi:hypothetical protein
MSTTFGPEIHLDDFDGFRLECACGDVRTGRLGDTEDQALAVPTSEHPRCTDRWCGEDQPRAVLYTALTWPEVNVNDRNARLVLDALGYPVEIDPSRLGECEPSDFLSRVLLAQAIAPADAGVPAHEWPGTGVRWVECGRSEGYLQRTLASLVEVAEWAREHDRKVLWG